MIQLKKRYFLIVTLYCAGIFWLSNMSDPPETFAPPPIPGADKVFHAVLYAGLAACLSFGIRRSNENPPGWIQWCVPAGFAILYGISDEIHQAFVPKRSADPWDLLADATGAILVQLILFRLWRNKPQTSPENA